MKKTKLFAFLSAVVVALGIFAASTFAADPAPSLSIKTLNLSVENAVYMVFKVADESIETTDMQLLVWENVPEAYKKGTEDACLTSNEVESDTGYTVFRHTDLAAKDMTKTVYACAYANVDGTEVYSAPVKYSIVMYADMKKTATDPDEALCAFLDTMLTYGAAAQTYFGHSTDFLATDEVHKVTVVNGTLDDGFSLGWYKEGSTVTLVADEPEEGYAFSHWVNTAGESVGTTATLDVSVNDVDTYTAVYKVAAPAYTEGLVFTLSNDETYYKITGYTGTATEVVIPATYEDLPVKEIGRQAFYNKSVTSVKIPDSVTSIAERAFSYCANLTSIAIPYSVTSIDEDPFHKCDSLTSITVDVSNTNYCSIDGNLYNKNVTTLIQYAGGKTDMSFTVPSSVIAIGSYAFSCGGSLTSVAFGEDSQLASIGRYAFVDSALTSISIPVNVTSIGYRAFSNTNLMSVEIPESVTRIDAYAFHGCGSLTSVTFGEGSRLVSVGEFAFVGCNFTRIEIPISVTSIGEGAFSQCQRLTNVEIPASVTIIGRNAFYSCSDLVSVMFVEGSQLATIGHLAFYGCYNLTSIEIPASVMSVGDSAFVYCRSLTTVFYGGADEAAWSAITISALNNDYLINATRYYYSETQPTVEGSFWHYDESGDPVIW